jgi:bifunctional UDP-N-acetylglucosamine pyrophosphorylase / glucosamine-1-phosphate N-acetyltransferase
MLTVLLVEDVTGEPSLCGRPAVDWLLDTVAALGPDVVTGESAGSRERIAAHPGLAGVGYPPAGDRCTLALRCSMPLVGLATLRRALREVRADGSVAAGTVVVEAVANEPWWADRPGVARPADVVALALAGDPGWPAVRMPGRPGGAGVAVRIAVGSPVESLSLNLPAERVRAENALYQRIAAGWLASGVRIDDPARTRIDAGVRIGAGAHIHPDTELIGDTVIGPDSHVGPATTIRDSRIGAGCLVQYSVCQHVEVGDHANIGPYCWLRSGSRLGARGRAGAFVEIADSVVGEDSSIPHLGGLIGADVGRGCNVAGLSGPANFDGVRKHRVRLGDHVSIGAGTILVAPLSLGDGAQTAAGSVITKDVPSGALAAARTEQRNFAGWTQEHRPGSAAARAAARHDG